MPPTNWQDIVSSIEHDSGPSAAGGDARPSQTEDNANSSSPDKTKKDRILGGWRRSERLRIEMLVDVCVCEEGQEPVFTRGKTLDVSAHGALLDLKMPVDIGQTLRLVNVRTKREIECHVLRFAKRYPEGGGEVGVEFAGMSRHFWDIPSPPADWDPDWVPAARPERPVPETPSTLPSPGGNADAWRGDMPRTGEPRKPYLPAARGKNVLKNPAVLKWPAIVLAAATVLFTAWIGMRGSKDADSTNASRVGVAPEDASRIPRIERTRLATPVDFDPDAVAWLRGSGQQVSGKVSGFYSGSKKSNAYILVGKANERRVVILAGGELRYNAEYPTVAIAACVPMELVHKINWAEASTPESDGDGLLIVRAADAPASGVMLFLRGSRVISASPVDYREIQFGQGCQI